MAPALFAALVGFASAIPKQVKCRLILGLKPGPLREFDETREERLPRTLGI